MHVLHRSLRISSATALILLSFVAAGFAQDPFLLDDPSLRHRLDTHTEVLLDPGDTLSFDDVRKPELQSRFRRSGGNLTFGYLASTIWLKLKLHTPSPHQRWYLEIPAPYLEYLDFYQLGSDSLWQKTVSGYYRKHSERQISHTGHVLPLVVDVNDESLVYVRIAGTSPKTFPIYAIEEAKFLERIRFEDLGYGVFFGILAVMFFYNFFIYVILKQRNYLYYCFTIICTFTIFAAISGYGGKFFWPETPVLNYYTGKLSLEVLVVSVAIFTLSFLEVRYYSKAVYYLLLSLFPLSAIALLLVMTGTFSFAGNTLASFAALVFMAAGLIVRIQGNKMADYYVAAWSIYLGGALLITLRNSGALDYNFWTTHSVEIGAVVETTIIGFALGHQYRKFKREKEEAQRMAIRYQLEAMSKLENEVHKRTEELYKTNENLQRTLETNRRQTSIIKNKNAELDTFFVRISHDLKGPINSALGLNVLAKLDVNDDRALKYFDQQEVQLERLRNIVNGLVKLTRLSSDEVQSVTIDFDKMIDDCITSLHWLSNFQRVSFKKEIQPALKFNSEWTLLNAIVQNLIENSIKYAGDQEPYVRVVIREESGWLVIEVEDNGQGIPAEHHQQVFDMFYRASKDEPGSGLGLYILKRSVDRLKGTIEIKSEVGVGSTFTVRLPSLKEVPLEA